MPNPGEPTVGPGATGPVVRRVQRALRRTPNLGLVVDGIFGPETEAAVISFQQGAGLVPDGIVGPLTWKGGPLNPVPNVCITPLVGGQWKKGKKFKYDLEIVSNKTAPNIPVDSPFDAIKYS